MLQTLIALVRQLVLLAVVLAFVESLLPPGSLRGYLRFVAGLAAIAVLIAPLGGLLWENPTWEMVSAPEVAVNGERVRQVGEEQALTAALAGALRDLGWSHRAATLARDREGYVLRVASDVWVERHALAQRLGWPMDRMEPGR